VVEDDEPGLDRPSELDGLFGRLGLAQDLDSLVRLERHPDEQAVSSSSSTTTSTR
jgi:hypothetical protein